MTTLEKIRKYAKENKLIFKDYRHDAIINNFEPQRYELIYPTTFAVYKGFNNQQDIIDFLKEKK